ncbi:hypothetical protein LX87_04119 [Larkinella arboricola]|uniref:Uncharacterized protein n=1 Tax=Larkinella arboricola TaxID=643671 RepID=A0A327WPU4_LARAB|nr:hypothetical protein LX87_04119 [Larkinella arboricola]
MMSTQGSEVNQGASSDEDIDFIFVDGLHEKVDFNEVFKKMETLSSERPSVENRSLSP